MESDVHFNNRDAEIDMRMRTARKGMNFVSAELMRARDKGAFSSYGERLYVGGLEDLEKRKRMVILPTQSS